MLGGRPETLARVQRLGFRLIEARPFAALGLSVLKLSTPTGLDARQGVALLHARYPELTADVNSLYGTYETEAAQIVSLPAPDYARRMIRWSGGEGCGAGLRIGMIDSALAAGLPTFAGRKLHQRSFVEPGHTAADPAHGTAIAALLVGAADPAHLTAGGLLPDADLYAAAVFERQGGQSQASAFAIAAALDWMVQNRVAVVNVSLAGDNNALMALAVHRASERGTILVAAAGNAGPDAPPAYPGALPEVIAVTAVDRDGAVFPEANRGDYIAFAAPGVSIWVPGPDGQGRLSDRHLLRRTLRARHRGAGGDAGRAAQCRRAAPAPGGEGARAWNRRQEPGLRLWPRPGRRLLRGRGIGRMRENGSAPSSAGLRGRPQIALAGIEQCALFGKGRLRRAKEIGPLVVPPTTRLNLLRLLVLVAYGRGVSLIRYARNAQQRGHKRRRHHSKATAAGEEGATCFSIFGV